MCLSVTLFSYNSQKESEQILLMHLNASHKILVNAPETILEYKEGKVYLDERQVYETDAGSFLSLANGEILSIPPMFSDACGFYFITLNTVGTKLFKCICNHCGHEWEGSFYDIWCEVCGRADFRIVPNR